MTLAFAAACSAPSGPSVAATSATPPTPEPSPTAQATAVTQPSGPVPTPDPNQVPFGLHSPLPLAGEYAVTANMDDHTLSVIPIGAAAVATTVQLDLAPKAIGAAPNSDTVFAADGAPSAHQLALASLDASSESGTIDVGVQPGQVAAPPPNYPSGPLLVIGDSDNAIRSLDPGSHALGAALPIGAGPHSVSIAAGNAMLSPQVFVANAGDGTISVLDQGVTTVQSTMQVGGRPVGVARTVDGRLWVADGDSGSVAAFDPTSGNKLDTIDVGPNLTGLAVTPDGHFLVLSSKDPDAALYAVDLVSSMIGGDSATPVRHIAVPGGVLALATGAEISRAYATTGDGKLIYWDLDSNSISESIAVGHNPVALALGIVEPSGSASVPSGPGTTTGGGTTGAGGGGAGGTTGAGSASTGAGASSTGAGATGAGASSTGASSTGAASTGASSTGAASTGAGSTGAASTGA
ncbi:MAG: hypothetical protein JO318_13760, partial [Chloroflexi bacterium]|nr:hypothetical protein [Chloroflexota bacterium]